MPTPPLYGTPIESLSAASIPTPESGSSAQKFRDVTEAYDVLSDPERRREHDVDLARSRTRLHVRPEPLIPDSPTRVFFRHRSSDLDQEIVRVFQIFEEAFGQIW